MIIGPIGYFSRNEIDSIPDFETPISAHYCTRSYVSRAKNPTGSGRDCES